LHFEFFNHVADTALLSSIKAFALKF